MHQKIPYWTPEHSKVIELLFELSATRSQIILIPGNHDHWLRRLAGRRIVGIKIEKEATIVTTYGKTLLTHGDLYDPILKEREYRIYFLCFLVDLFKRIGWDCGFHRLHKFTNSWLRQKIFNTFDYHTKVADSIISHCRKENYDAVICGHLHTLCIHEKDDFAFLTCGDWVENYSAITEGHDFQLSLYRHPNFRTRHQNTDS